MSKILKNYLVEQAYEIIALPKENLKPLDLLILRGQDLQEYDAGLLDLFQPDVKGLPIVKRRTADFSGNRFLETDASLGADLLSNLFQLIKLGANQLAGSLSRKKDVLVAFSFENVIEYKVRRQALDDFIVTAIPIHEGFVRSKERLLNSELYVITSLLTSNGISVEFLDSKEIAGDLNAEIHQLANMNAKVKSLKGNQLSISFEGDKSFAFAYRAARIIYDKKSWLEFWQKESRFTINDQKGMVMRAEEEFQVDLLKSENGISYF